MVFKTASIRQDNLVVRKSYVCISEESMSCASLSDKEIQTERHTESYPKTKKHIKTIYDTQKEESECQYSSSQPQVSLSKFNFAKELTENDILSDSDDTMKECLRIFNEVTKSEACKGEIAKQVGQLFLFSNLCPKYKGVSLKYIFSKYSKLCRICRITCLCSTHIYVLTLVINNILE